MNVRHLACVSSIAVKEWPKLVRFLDICIWPLDSNLVENAIRPFIVGRRSGLFADTVGGANASANLYSLIETAKANHIEPYHHLVALFKKLPLAQSVDDSLAPDGRFQVVTD